jgi:hypothetical protein
MVEQECKEILIASDVLRRCMSVGLLACVVVCGSTRIEAGQGPRKVKVHFVVTDCWGRPIQKARVQILSGTAPRYLQYPEKQTIELEHGTYTVIVDSEGFRRIARQITVEEKDKLFNFCLNVADIETIENERLPSLIGHVSTTARFLAAGPVWVRLMGLYSDLNVVALVEENGSFSIDRLQPGRYSLMLFVNGELKRTRQIDMRTPDTKVSID